MDITVFYSQIFHQFILIIGKKIYSRTHIGLCITLTKCLTRSIVCNLKITDFPVLLVHKHNSRAVTAIGRSASVNDRPSVLVQVPIRTEQDGAFFISAAHGTQITIPNIPGFKQDLIPRQEIHCINFIQRLPGGINAQAIIPIVSQAAADIIGSSGIIIAKTHRHFRCHSDRRVVQQDSCHRKFTNAAITGGIYRIPGNRFLSAGSIFVMSRHRLGQRRSSSYHCCHRSIFSGLNIRRFFSR